MYIFCRSDYCRYRCVFCFVVFVLYHIFVTEEFLSFYEYQDLWDVWWAGVVFWHSVFYYNFGACEGFWWTSAVFLDLPLFEFMSRYVSALLSFDCMFK